MAVDPSHTKTLRRDFAQRLRGIWARINAQARHDIVDRDVFGIRGGTSPTANAPPQPIHDLSFETDGSKIEAFKRWLRRQARRARVDVFTGESNTYIRSAYQRGMKNADTALRGEGVDVPQDVEVSVDFNMPVHQQQVQNLYTRVLSEWDGIVAAVEQQIGRELADGFAQGEGMQKIARRISDRISAVGKKRATDLARTEIIRSSAEASLTRYEQAGVDEVTAEVEFLATNDNRVCQLCKSLDGEVYPIPEARGTIPLHPRCRCTWIIADVDSEQLTLSANKTTGRKAYSAQTHV